MLRILGVNLPNKRIVIALTYIHGIGRSSALRILRKLDIDVNKKTDAISDDETNRIRKEIEEFYLVEGDLKAKVYASIKRTIEINCHKGTRHRRKLPVRGQRTKTNARTRKGTGKTIANKKMVKK